MVRDKTEDEMWITITMANILPGKNSQGEFEIKINSTKFTEEKYELEMHRATAFT